MASTSERFGPGQRTRWPVVIAAVVLMVAEGACAEGVASQQACADGASTMPLSRFQDNGDGTVTDRVSKLMWMRCASGQQWTDGRCSGQAMAYNWPDAVQQAEHISAKGTAFFNDWRLPALRDLATITDRGCKNPRTNVAVFPGTPAMPFWTSTPRPGDASEERAFALSFGAEGVVLARKGERFAVRLVRNAL